MMRVGSDTHISEKSLYDQQNFVTNDNRIIVTANETHSHITRVNSSHTLGNGIHIANRIPGAPNQENQAKAGLPIRHDRKMTEIKRVQSSSINVYDPTGRLFEEPIKTNNSGA
jgi:hypothetical protein